MTAQPENFERLIQSIDRIDTIRRQSAQIEDALGSADRDKVLVEKLMATYNEQGIALDRSVVEKAVSETLPTRALPIPAPAHPVGHTLARAWIKRDKWFPPLFLGFNLAVALAFVLTIINVVGGRIDEGRLRDAISKMQEINQQVDTAMASAASFKIERPVQRDLVQSAMALLTQADAQLDMAQRQADSPGDAGDRYEAIQNSNQMASSNLLQASNTLGVAVEVSSYARQLEQAEALVAKGTGWPQLDESLAARLVTAKAMLEDPARVQELPQVLSTINGLTSGGRQRAAMHEAAKGIPADGADQATSLVAAGEAALLNGQLDAAEQAISSLRDLARMGAASYTLRITNEPGEKTGVWRHHSDSPNARNHYIVVDAVDAAGSPVQVSVVNEEDGSRHLVSRFAVRVPERIYNQVGQDKMDNGLVDNNVFGSKKPGTVKTEYAFENEGGIITHW